MNDLEFELAVRRMRHWQKLFFKSRRPDDLTQAKRLEQRVDAELMLRAESRKPRRAARPDAAEER